MQLSLLPLLALLSIGLVASHAALPPQLYWQSLLPSTPIPSSLSHLLPSSTDWREDKGGINARNFQYGYPPKHADWREDKGGVNARTFRYKYPPKHADWREDNGGDNARNFRYRYPPKHADWREDNGVDNARPFRYTYGPPQTQLHDGPNVGGKGGGVHVNTPHVGVNNARPFRYIYPPKHADWREDNGGDNARNFRYRYPPKHADWREDNGVDNARPFRYTYGSPQTQLHDGPNVGGKGGGVHVNTPHVGVDNARPFRYKYGPPQTQLHDGPNVALFFLENDIKADHKMKLHFTQSSNQASFLPRELANSIPFSSAKFNDILNRFDIKPESEDAEVMKNTVKDCEEEGIKGEEKFCATSLESMVDFTTSKLGNEVDALSTEAVKDTRMQEYTIAPGVKEVGVDEAVVCHRQEYPYAVFYCHKTEGTRAYTVPLEGADGVKVKAVAVCHTDTSEWNPEHLAFQVLKVKPGTVPVCHFLPQDHVVWVPKYLRSLTGSS